MPESPVTTSNEQLIRDDRPSRRGPLPGIALCLSGGGFRAMLFHLGALAYLNDAGLLGTLTRISSVSGGSLVAAHLGLRWRSLEFDSRGVAGNFREEVVTPIRRLASMRIDRGAVAGGLLPSGSAGERLIARYRAAIFGDATLQDLPLRPRFVINATNLQSGALFRFSRPYLWDYRVGKIAKPQTPVAEAVAASSAFPPLLSPVVLRFPPDAFVPDTGEDLQRAPFTREVVLTDGGVYDNLGIETAWKRYRTVLVSDGGAKMEAEKLPKGDWIRQTLRVMNVIDNQVRCLRKRQVIAAFRARRRSGAYWGIGSDIARFRLADAFDCPHEKTRKLAAIPTRLDTLPDVLQMRLINWGYAVTDASIRKHVHRKLTRPAELPYEGGVG
jgi:NTE family protein